MQGRQWIVPAALVVAVLGAGGYSAVRQKGRAPVTERGNSGLKWTKADASLALLNGAKLVWRLNYKRAEGKPYFHPLGTLDGTVLTDLRPKDHPWHRAVWFSWKHINGLNYWEENRRTGLSQGRTEITAVKVTPNDDYSAKIELALAHHPPDKPVVLAEKRLISVAAPDKTGRYHVDWRSTFTAGEKDVLLDRTPIPGQKGGRGYGGYAGLSLRMAPATRKWQYIDSEGRKGSRQIHGKNARWVDFSGPVADGKAAGVAVLDHPGNPRHPSPWYVNQGMPYFSPALLFNESRTLEAGKSLALRYRIIVHPGRGDGEMLDKEWKAFSTAAAPGREKTK